VCDESGILKNFEFQFHIGAIRRFLRKKEQLSGNLFQFHIGAIRSLAFTTDDRPNLSFNSILVQLEGIYEIAGPATEDDVSIPYWCN